MEKNVILSTDVKDKLLALDRTTAIIWSMSFDDPEYQKYRTICKNLQEELMGTYGLSPQMINDFTYGEGGVIYG